MSATPDISPFSWLEATPTIDDATWERHLAAIFEHFLLFRNATIVQKE
jgi:hypothetical protein